MSDERPNKIVEPSPIEKWWEEVKAKREAKRKAKGLTPRPVRRPGKRRNTRPPLRRTMDVFNLLEIPFTIFGFIIEMVIMVIGFGFRIVWWLIIAAGIIWFFNIDVGEVDTPENREKVEEFKTETKDFIESIRKEVEGMHIEREETEDGGTSIRIEWNSGQEDAAEADEP